MIAHKVVIAIKFGEPAPTSPATEDRARVMLNAGFRPIKSAVMGQIEEPRTKPVYLPTVRTAQYLARCTATMGSLLTSYPLDKEFLLHKGADHGDRLHPELR